MWAPLRSLWTPLIKEGWMWVVGEVRELLVVSSGGCMKNGQKDGNKRKVDGWRRNWKRTFLRRGIERLSGRRMKRYEKRKSGKKTLIIDPWDYMCPLGYPCMMHCTALLMPLVKPLCTFLISAGLFSALLAPQHLFLQKGHRAVSVLDTMPWAKYFKYHRLKMETFSLT